MSKRARNSKGTRGRYGMYVIGETRIFCREKTVKSRKGGEYTFEEYTTTISRLNEDGKYTNLYIPVFFAKGLDKPENNSVVELQDSNLFVSGNAGYERISLYVKQWDYAD